MSVSGVSCSGPVRKRVLDKAAYVGVLSVDLPDCVLCEIAQNRSVNVDEEKLASLTYKAKVFSIIENTRPAVVSYPPKRSDLPEVAAFLNPGTEWPTSSLRSSFDAVWDKYWAAPPTRHLITKETVYGFPSPTNIDSMSPVVVYSILKRMGVAVTHKDTFESMTQALRLTLVSRRSIVREIALALPLLRSDVLLTVALQLGRGQRLRPKMASTDKVGKEIGRLFTKARVGASFVPFSCEEAIAASAIFYSTDISLSENPLREYSNIVFGRDTEDAAMRDLESANPSIFDTKVSFNPSLPARAYEITSLKSMCESAGVSLGGKKRTVHDYYNALLVEFGTKRFHYDVVIGVKTLETSLYMTDLRRERVPRVSYGSFADGFVVYTVQELVDMFCTDKFFHNPVTGTSFSRDCIMGLRKICSNNDYNTHWGTLLNTIDGVSASLPELPETSEDLARRFLDSSDEEKKCMRDLLYYVLYCGLRMRGWDGIETSWPVKEVSTVVDADAQALCCTEYLARILQKSDEMGDLGEYILSLPLLYIRRDSDEVYINTDNERGLTLRGRIRIVVTNASVHACTRSTSNYFLITACHYLAALGVNLPYAPKDVRIIG